jgi:phosphoribosylformylglycinamidine cyclo-ligase
MIALPSSGVHSNGFSLVRKVFDVENADLVSPVAELGGRGLGEALLEPTKIYVKPMLALFGRVEVHGVSHITGGGFYENIPRSLPDGLGVKIAREDVRVPQIFRLIARTGGIPERDMYNTFNMGVGMCAAVAAADADLALSVLRDNGEDAYVLGTVGRSEEKVVLL